MIIWIASYPRSGNNLTRNMIESVYGVKTYAMYHEPRQPKIDIETARNSDETFLIKTHDLPLDDSPALYLVRDGRDALVSYARFLYVESMFDENRVANVLVYPAYGLHYILVKMSRGKRNLLNFKIYSTRFKRRRVKQPTSQDLWQILHGLLTTNQNYGGWGPNVRAWTQRKAPTQVVKFEDIVHDPDAESVIKKNLETLGYKLGPAVGNPQPFSQLQKIRPDVYRKGKIGSHKDEMPADLEALFWEQNGQLMEQLGYSR